MQPSPSGVGVLAFDLDNQSDYDLLAILSVIGAEVVENLVWIVSGLEWVGDERARQFNIKAGNAPREQITVHGSQLLQLSEHVLQVIEGVFVGYHEHFAAEAALNTTPQLHHFGLSPAEVAVRFVDGWHVDLYLRPRAYVDAIRKRFPKAQWQDPARYCLE